MFRTLTTLASPGGRWGKLSTFMFHRVPASFEPLLPDEPHAARFEILLGWIAEQFQVLEPIEACRRLAQGSLPPRAAVISFDDGYRDNFDVALPLLQARKLPAVFFIASGFSNGSAMFNDRIHYAVRESKLHELHLQWLSDAPVKIVSNAEKRAAIESLIATVKHEPQALRDGRVDSIVDAAGADAPSGLMMAPPQLQALSSAGMTIGGHTRSHPILMRLSPDAARKEIQAGRSDLFELTRTAPLLFAYPNGRRNDDYDSAHKRMVKAAGFEFAFCTHRGFSTRRTDPFELRRFTPWDRQRWRFAGRALTNLLG